MPRAPCRRRRPTAAASTGPAARTPTTTTAAAIHAGAAPRPSANGARIRRSSPTPSTASPTTRRSRYQPPLKADGTSWPNQDSGTTVGWTLVKNDAYNVQNTNSINLLTQFPDTEWCTDDTFTDCLRNGNYVLPGSVNGKAYTTFHAVTATGSGHIAIGQPDAATTEARSFGPHYYTITPYEWCDGPNLRNCQAGAGGAFTYPAPVRWCSSDANAIAATPAAGSCQAIRTATYSNARYPTKFFTPVVPAKAGRRCRRRLDDLHASTERHLHQQRRRPDRVPAIAGQWRRPVRRHRDRRPSIGRTSWPDSSATGSTRPRRRPATRPRAATTRSRSPHRFPRARSRTRYRW